MAKTSLGATFDPTVGQKPTVKEDTSVVFDPTVSFGTMGISSGSPYKKKTNPDTLRKELLQELAEDTGVLKTLGISFGKGLGNVARGLNLGPEFGDFGDQNDPIQAEAMAALSEESPVATTIGEAAGEAAPFLAMAGPAASAEGLLGRSLGGGLLAGTEGGVISSGRGGDVTTGAGIGAGIGVAAEVLIPVVGRLGGAVVRKITGKPPSGAMLDVAGNPTTELVSALDNAGITFEDLTSDAVELVKNKSGEFVPEQLARSEFLKSQGLKPTTAQVTRDAADFQAQQEAAKTTGRVRQALEGQDATLTTRFNDAIVETTGSASMPTNTVVDAVVEKATVLDNQISALYKQAREMSPGAKNVKFNRLLSALKRYSPANTRTGGDIEAVLGELKSMGVLDKNLKLQGKVSVESAEEVRKYINSLYDEKNPFASGILRKLKDSLDDDVFSVAGDDVFKSARKAKADFEKELNRQKISKFDTRKQNVVRDVLENKIPPDELVNKLVYGKTWRPEDIKQLREYVSSAGDAPFNDFKAEVLNSIKERAFIGAEDASGVKTLSRDKLEKALKQIGWKKLGVIFDKKEIKFLRDMLNVSKLREPVRGTALGKGPSAQAILSLENRLKEMPLLGGLVKAINVDSAGRAVLKGKPGKIVNDSLLTLPRAASAIAVPAVATDKEGTTQ